MKRRGFIAGLAAWPLGVAVAAPNPGPIAVIVNNENPNQRIGSSQLLALFTAEMKTWPGDGMVAAFNYPPEHPLRVAFDAWALRMSPEEVGRFWLDQRIRGNGRPPRQIPDPGLVLRLVARLPGAVGYVPAAIADATVRVVCRVVDGKVVTS